MLRRNQIHRRLGHVRNSRSFVYFKLKIYKKVIGLLKKQANKGSRMENNYYAVRYVHYFIFYLNLNNMVMIFFCMCLHIATQRYLCNRNTKNIFFVIWCVRAAKQIKNKRYINYIINRRFKNQLWLAFFAWYNMWERSTYIRNSEKVH